MQTSAAVSSRALPHCRGRPATTPKQSNATGGILGLYLAEIAKTPLLTQAEEAELAQRIADTANEVTANGKHSADYLAAYQGLVRANLRLVVKIARGYLGRGLPLHDLVGEGNIGLCCAAERYELSYGVRFSTYASYWIKQAIGRAVRDDVPIPRIPAHVVQMLLHWNRKAAELTAQSGERPTDAEIVAALGLKPRQIKMVAQAMMARSLIRRYEGSNVGMMFEEVVSDPSAGAVDSRLVADDEFRRITGRLDELIANGVIDHRSGDVLMMRHGIGMHPLKLSEVGQRFGITRDLATRIQRDAERGLRTELAGATG